jgi:hypothetical protein
MSPHASPHDGSLPWGVCSRLSEIALVLVRFDYIATTVTNADHSVM